MLTLVYVFIFVFYLQSENKEIIIRCWLYFFSFFQHGTKTFNKGILFNAAFHEILESNAFDCLIFHDVDLIPENDRNMYTCENYPRHMSPEIDKFDYMYVFTPDFRAVWDPFQSCTILNVTVKVIIFVSSFVLESTFFSLQVHNFVRSTSEGRMCQ